MESDATIFQFSAASEAASGTALDCFQGQQGGVFSSIGLGDAPRARRDGCGLSSRQGKRHHASIFSYFVPRSFDQKEAVRRPFRTHELVWLYHQPLRSWLMSAVASRLIPFYPLQTSKNHYCLVVVIVTVPLFSKAICLTQGELAS